MLVCVVGGNSKGKSKSKYFICLVNWNVELIVFYSWLYWDFKNSFSMMLRSKFIGIGR